MYAYTGGTPELISENFGTRRFDDAVAGTDGERYYISMRDSKGNWNLYVFDTMRGVWLREDGTHATDFAPAGRRAVLPDGGTGKLMKTGQDYSEEGRIPWSATPLQDGRDHPRTEGLLQAVPAGGPGGRVLAQDGDQRG